MLFKAHLKVRVLSIINKWLKVECGKLGPHERGKNEGGAQDGRLTITSAEKYAKVCREGAALGTERCSLMTPSTKQYMLPLK
jgi:hypothetical protein